MSLKDNETFNINIPGNDDNYSARYVSYERTSEPYKGSDDEVVAVYKEGKEISHRTYHPDGTINNHGVLNDD